MYFNWPMKNTLNPGASLGMVLPELFLKMNFWGMKKTTWR
jgi:hypothetical protein